MVLDVAAEIDVAYRKALPMYATAQSCFADRVRYRDARALGTVRRVAAHARTLNVTVEEYTQRALSAVLARPYAGKSGSPVNDIGSAAVFSEVRARTYDGLCTVVDAYDTVSAHKEAPAYGSKESLFHSLRRIHDVLRGHTRHSASTLIAMRGEIDPVWLFDHPQVNKYWRGAEGSFCGISYNACWCLHCTVTAQLLPWLAALPLYRWWNVTVCGGQSRLSPAKVALKGSVNDGARTTAGAGGGGG